MKSPRRRICTIISNGKLKEQESIIKHLSAANEKLRVDFDENIKTCEDEKRGLVLALEKANDKAEIQEQQVCQYRKEIESLKSSLSVSKKCFETEKSSKSAKELSERDGMFVKLEEEKVKLEDQLKWKKEQFKHLEEAYEKLKGQVKSSKKEWEMEKSTLLDEISSLEVKLDSQIRISEDLRHQLQTCHQALAHVERQKKRLEVEVLDFRLQLENAGSEYRDSRVELRCLNSDRDKDVADLRYSLKTKEAYIKETKYQIEKLQEENQELRMSVKELQEAQIQEAGASYSQSKLRTKLRNLEQTHKECASNIKAREAEWNLQIEQLNRDYSRCQSELEAKIAELEELQKEIEKSHSITIEMKLSNEEMNVIMLVLTQGISEAQLKIANYKDEMDIVDKEKEVKIFELKKQLEMKDNALIGVQNSINEEREKAACFMREVESYGFNNELQHELDRYKKMLEESKEQLRETHEALDIAINELNDIVCERNEMEFELQIWKSIVERLKNDLGVSHLARKELEASLLAQIVVDESIKQEKNKVLEELQKEVVLLEQESFRREFESFVIAKGTMERKLKTKNENLIENATKMSLERENLLAFFQGLYDRIFELSNADTELRDMLRSMEQCFEVDCAGRNMKNDDGFFNVKENKLVQASPISRIKKVEAISDMRSPFKELNSC